MDGRYFSFCPCSVLSWVSLCYFDEHRCHLSRHVKACLGFNFVEVYYRFVCWKSYCDSSVRSSILFIYIYRLIADCSSTENRNKYLTILEAVISAASVLGPALGGILGQYSYSLPLYFAGCVAGVAMLFSFFFLQETNKDVRDIKVLKKQMKHQSEGT